MTTDAYERLRRDLLDALGPVDLGAASGADAVRSAEIGRAHV